MPHWKYPAAVTKMIMVPGEYAGLTDMRRCRWKNARVEIRTMLCLEMNRNDFGEAACSA